MNKFIGIAFFEITIYQKCSFAKITISLSAASINNIIGKRFIELLSVDSTNNYAMQQVKQGIAKHGDSYFAHEQTAGKGQLNKQWFSAQGENIILSVIIDTRQFDLSRQFKLNMIAALSVMEFFNNYTTEKIKIKWPNDIYCRDRKAAGILIENIIRGKTWQFAIAGFGININQTHFSDELKNPVSLKQLTGENYDVVALAKKFCSILNKNIQPLFSEKEDNIIDNYNSVLYKRNQIIQFKKDNKIFGGLVKEVDSLGRLIVETENEIKIFESGQLEWMPG